MCRRDEQYPNNNIKEYFFDRIKVQVIMESCHKRKMA